MHQNVYFRYSWCSCSFLHQYLTNFGDKLQKPLIITRWKKQSQEVSQTNHVLLIIWIVRDIFNVAVAVLHVLVIRTTFRIFVGLSFGSFHFVAQVQIDDVFQTSFNQLIVQFSAMNLSPNLVFTYVLFPESHSVLQTLRR